MQHLMQRRNEFKTFSSYLRPLNMWNGKLRPFKTLSLLWEQMGTQKHRRLYNYDDFHFRETQMWKAL